MLAYHMLFLPLQNKMVGNLSLSDRLIIFITAESQTDLCIQLQMIPFNCEVPIDCEVFITNVQ